MNVAQILADKKPAVISIKPDHTIGQLADLLKAHRIGAAVVSSDGQTIEGVITERDLTYGLAQHKSDLYALPVSAVMTRKVITCSPDDNVGMVASSMLSNNVRHIPVADNGRVVGMVSIRDVLRLRVDELQRQTAMLHGLVGETAREMQDR